MSIKKNLLKNGIATAFQKAVRVLEQLLLVPFFISAWGAAYYGEWITLTIIPSVLAFSDLGFGTAAANSFVLKYAAGEKQSAADIYKSGFTIISVMILFGSCISVISLLVMSHYNLFERSLISQNDAIWAVSILIIARLIGFYTQLFEGMFRAARRAAMSINFLTFNALANIGAGLIILLLKGGVIHFAISQLVVSLLFNIFFGVKAIATLGLHREFVGTVTKSDIKSITSAGFGYLMSPMWQVIFFQGSTFVVRLTLGAEAVAIFNTVRTATRAINQLFNMLDSIIFPEMLYEVGEKNLAKAGKLYRLSIWCSFILGFFGVLFLFFFGLYIYNTWTHNKLHVDKLTWNIFILGILFNALWWTGGIVFRAVNKPYKFTVFGVVCSVISVSITYFLAPLYGLTGAALGCLSLEIFMAIYVLPTSCKLLDMSITDIFSYARQDLLSIKVILNKKFSSSK